MPQEDCLTNRESIMVAHPSRATRRQFLRQSATALVGAWTVPLIVPASSLGNGEKVAPSERITLGIIGTGNQGLNDLRGFLRDMRVQVVAVCDVNREGPGYWNG